MPAFGPITMTTKAEHIMARVIRMTTMSIATSAGLHVDKVEDVALATNEAFATATRWGTAETMTCVVEADPGTIKVHMLPIHSENRNGTPDLDPDPLTARILQTITEDLVYEPATGGVSFRVSNP
jgi:hypothetical protein